ncbi:MAG: sulfatase-like hydrolase/transferase [Candidatus Aminicenantales bacterium]
MTGALRKAAVPLILALFLVLPAAAGPGTPPPGPPARLNLLLITIDTLRADRVGALSSKSSITPNMDRLASRSVVFTRAFAHTPMTLPSHTNILLGTTPSFHGVHDNADFMVRGEFLTLAEHLQARHYATGAFVGGFPLDSYFGLDQGFAVYDDAFRKRGGGLDDTTADLGERPAGEVWRVAQKWLRAQKTPWFLWIHFYDPHEPYDPPEPYRARFARDPYDGEVAYADAVLGDVLDALRDMGVEETTAVVFTGDHGESLGEHDEDTHGFLAYNATMWIPLFVRAPGIAPRVVGQNVSHIDIFPTVCDILGIDRPGSLQGASLLPLMRGKKISDRPVYFEALSPYYTMDWAPLRGFIDGQKKFIDSPLPELYDLGKDFSETRNLAGDADVAALRRSLEAIVRSQSSEEGARAERAPDQAALEKLRSLGYLGGLSGPRKASFGPEDSVASLLPYQNRAAKAMELYRQGKTAEAIAALREILAARKNISAAYVDLATIYRKEHALDDALAVLRLGVEAVPGNYEIHFQDIAILYESGRFDEALGAFETRNFPQAEFDPVIWNYIGLARWKKADVTGALASFDKSLAIDSELALTYHNRGTVQFDVFRRTGRSESYSRALADFQKAVGLDPAYSPAYFSLGVAYFQAGSFALATGSLEKALSLDPGLDEAYFFLGSAQLKLGDKPSAYRNLTRFKTTPAYESLSPAAKKRVDNDILECKPGR